MSDCPRGLVLKVGHQVYNLERLFHKDASYALHPLGDSSREHKALQFGWASLPDRSHNLLNVFLEAKVEHLIGLIQNRNFKVREVEVLPFNVVLDTPSGSYKEVDSLP